MGYKYKLKEIEVGDEEVRDGFLSTVTDIDPQTGGITWDILQIPNLDKLLDESDDLVKTAKGVYVKTKNDKKFLEIYEDSRKLRNTIRTHIRNNYPEEYKKSRGVNEEIDIKAPIAQANLAKANNQINNSSGLADYILDVINQIKNKEQEGLFNNSNIKQAISFLEKARGVDEISTSGAAGAYNTPYAFRKKGSKPDDEAYKELGYKLVKEKALPVVRKKLAKVPKAKKVASKYRMKMPSGLVSTLGYTVSEDATKSANIHKQGQHPGEDLGPGPKAGDEGVTDNAYTKQFKYKLVPKTKDGTYVQKGSGMVVKNLF